MSLFVISTVPRTDAWILLSIRYVPWPLNGGVDTSWSLLRRWWGLQGRPGSSCLRQSCSGWHLFELLSFAISSTNLVYNKQNQMEELPSNNRNIYINVKHQKILNHHRFYIYSAAALAFDGREMWKDISIYFDKKYMLNTVHSVEFINSHIFSYFHVFFNKPIKTDLEPKSLTARNWIRLYSCFRSIPTIFLYFMKWKIAVKGSKYGFITYIIYSWTKLNNLQNNCPLRKLISIISCWKCSETHRTEQ